MRELAKRLGWQGRGFGRAGVLALGLALASCDNGSSAVETRDRTQGPAPAVLEVIEVPPAAIEPIAPTPVTANRRETADAKVQRLFARNGASFGAATPEDYLDQIKTFTSRPPKGTQVVKRANGDTLLYQGSTNTFAVVDRAGVPRTMFKPDNGADYWARQKEDAPTFGQGRSYGQGRP